MLYMVFAVFKVVLLCLRMSFRRIVGRSVSLLVVVVLLGLGFVGYGPCSEAADGGIRLRKCDI